MSQDQKPVTPLDIASAIGDVAAKLVDCVELDARDRNTAIGNLRNVAAFVIGAEGLNGYKQAPFAPTTKPAAVTPPAPTPDTLPNTPPRT